MFSENFKFSSSESMTLPLRCHHQSLGSASRAAEVRVAIPVELFKVPQTRKVSGVTGRCDSYASRADTPQIKTQPSVTLIRVWDALPPRRMNMLHFATNRTGSPREKSRRTHVADLPWDSGVREKGVTFSFCGKRFSCDGMKRATAC